MSGFFTHNSASSSFKNILVRKFNQDLLKRIKFQVIILINLLVFALGNSLLFLILLDDATFDLLTVALTGAIYTTLHLIICLGSALFYRIQDPSSGESRSWFWSSIIVAVLGLSYYALLIYIK